MVSSLNRIGSRRGFTLIELLVVILIIGVLVGLLLPAISAIREKANIATAQSDIGQISIGIGNWQTTNSKWLIDNIKMVSGVTNVGSPPPAAVPRVNMSVNAPTGDPAGFDWLKRTWPRLLAVDPNFATTANPTNNIPDLNLDTGNKCLVFFLMGPDLQGSSKSGTDPVRGNPPLNSPYLDFPSSRVVNSQIVDPWGTPYVYFAARGSSGYQALTFNWTNPDGEASQVAPYVEPGTYTGRAKFANQTSFQIISAGPDRRFGPGTATGTGPFVSNWTPEQGEYVETKPGFDDLSNFSGGKQLGVK